MQKHPEFQHHAINNQYDRVALVFLPEDPNHRECLIINITISHCHIQSSIQSSIEDPMEDSLYLHFFFHLSSPEDPLS
jgi:hypothetical protein